MCGIFAVIGSREVSSLLIDGLRKLEYRGYDSAGIATIENLNSDQNGQLNVTKSKGKLINLSNLINVLYSIIMFSKIQKCNVSYV